METTILAAVRHLPVTVVGPQGVLVAEGARTSKLYVLKSGDLEVVREGSAVASMDEPGAVVGELSALLDVPHSPTVRSRHDAEVHVIDDVAGFLDAHPAVSQHIARQLARRLHKTTALLVDMRARRPADGRQDLRTSPVAQAASGGRGPM